MIFFILLKQDEDSKLKKLQDFKTILAAIINLKILENSQECVYSEVICL